MKIINFGETRSVINQYMSELRDINVQNDRAHFRNNLRRIGQLMAYEVSKVLTYSPKSVQTPLGIASVNTHDDDLVLGTIFRAGLPYHQGFLDIFDHAGNAFVSAYRFYKDKECEDVGIKIDYLASPDLGGKTLIIADPMLATGGSAVAAVDFIKQHGGKHIKFMSIIAAPQGIERLLKAHPDIQLYVGHVDRELNENAYICPGLGDAGDRIFGTK